MPEAGEWAEITTAALSERLGIQEYQELRRLRNTLSDLVTTGEVARLRPGVFEYVGKTKVTKEYLMWRRLRRGATVKDLMIFAGATKDYAQEWLRMLTERGLVVVDEGGMYRLVKDGAFMPKSEAKAERLRVLRRNKKIATRQALQDARTALEKAVSLLDEVYAEDLKEELFGLPGENDIQNEKDLT